MEREKLPQAQTEQDTADLAQNAAVKRNFKAGGLGGSTGPPVKRFRSNSAGGPVVLGKGSVSQPECLRSLLLELEIGGLVFLPVEEQLAKIQCEETLLRPPILPAKVESTGSGSVDSDSLLGSVSFEAALLEDAADRSKVTGRAASTVSNGVLILLVSK